MKFRDIIEGKNTKSKCSDELHALAKKTNGSETREIQVIAGKLDNFAATGNPGVIADAVKVLKQMDAGPRAKVMEIIKKSDPSMAKSLARKSGLNEEVDELSEGKKLRNVLSDKELEKSMKKALADKSNYKGGKVNWPFIDADVYMELSAKGYDLRHPSINYMDRFDAMADKLDPMNETELSESHFKVGDKVKCKASGMTGEVIKVGDGEGAYYTVKREDGSTKQYEPSELTLVKEMTEARRDAPKGSKETSNENPLVTIYDDGFERGKPGMSGHMNLQTWMAIHGVSAKYQKEIAEMVMKAGTGKKVKVPAKPMADNAKEYKDEGKEPKTYWLELSKHHEKEMKGA
jgi:hypothetical protein